MSSDGLMVVDSSCEEYVSNQRVLDEKLRKWDELLEAYANNILSAREAVLMLKDPSVYAYAFLKDENGERVRVTCYQDLILNKKHDYSPLGVNRFILWIAANQTGKTFGLGLKAIHTVFTEDNVNVAIVSKNLDMSKFVLSQIKLMLNRSIFGDTWKEELGDQANMTVLTFTRDEGKVVNRIICAPSTEGLLGYPVHLLLLDEADFYEDAKSFFYKVAMPRTNKTKGQIIIFSNPNPMIARSESLLYELVNGDLFQRKYRFGFLDAPWNTIGEYERNKKVTPSYIFSSTHDGLFGQDAGSFFTQAELERTFRRDWSNDLPVVDRPVYIGVDFGQIHDNTVLSLGVAKYEDGVSSLDVRYLQVFDLKTPYIVILERLKELVEYYTINYQGVGGIGFDKTGVGAAMSEFVQLERDLSITDITWSSERKTKLYNDFKLLVENNRIRIVYTDQAFTQLSGLSFKKTPRGYLTVDNASNSIHDDIPSSICMLIAVSIKPGFITPGLKFISHNVKQEEELGSSGGWSSELSKDDLEDIESAKRLMQGNGGSSW